ncbi:hypothetical protein BDN67DRAFT_983563 [Paxillus ammoniavirescens]|nr:hypothetical protein BDN67DRAFT_983563 [Paxillus ammoniavirescens]
MPSGRPRLYQTPEEKVLAALSYRAKYYDCQVEEEEDHDPLPFDWLVRMKWTTDEQLKHLIQEVPAFHEPGLAESDPSTDEQSKMLCEVIDKQEQWATKVLQYCAGFRCLANIKRTIKHRLMNPDIIRKLLVRAFQKNRAANRKIEGLVKDLLKLKTRVKRNWEIYSKEFYHERVKSELRQGSNINNHREAIEEAFRNKLPEVEERIHSI